MPRSDFYENESWEKEDFPPSWVPERSDDFVGGVVKRYSVGTARWREQERRCPIVVLEVERIRGGADVREGEEVGVWLLHDVLLGEFENKRPKRGERIGIRYLGQPQGKAYHDYVLRIDRAAEEEEVPDFSQFRDATSDGGAAPRGTQDASAAFRPDPQRTADPEGRYPPDREGGEPGAPRGDRPPPQDDGLPF